MIARYKGKEYKYATYLAYGRMNYAIGTTDVLQTDASFLKSSITDEYFKIVDRVEINDIYEAQIFVIFDSGIPGVKNTWIIDTSWYAIVKKDEIRIVYFDGYLQGWEKVDRDTYVRWIKKSECKGAKLVLQYQKKDGVEYQEPLREEIMIDIYELEKYLEYYKKYK